MPAFVRPARQEPQARPRVFLRRKQSLYEPRTHKLTEIQEDSADDMHFIGTVPNTRHIYFRSSILDHQHSPRKIKYRPPPVPRVGNSWAHFSNTSGVDTLHSAQNHSHNTHSILAQNKRHTVHRKNRRDGNVNAAESVSRKRSEATVARRPYTRLSRAPRHQKIEFQAAMQHRMHQPTDVFDASSDQSIVCGRPLLLDAISGNCCGYTTAETRH